ncbi:MAG: M20/M25/M40 family metallo-hydrolase [Gemmatimonadota bacterium]|nr:M20/M25/M40 family metallo-hydrolase [Gemmatimonadota bacterium]
MHSVVVSTGRARFRQALILLAVLGPTAALSQMPERVDTAVVTRIRDEGFNRSQVMETVSWLTDVYGPRLTGSPNTRAAAEWTIRRLASWGISNGRMEPWGTFGIGWSNQSLHVRAVTPQPYPIIANVAAWTPSTNGWVRGEAVLANDITDSAAFARYSGKLRGKFVLVSDAPTLVQRFNPDARRYSDSSLNALTVPPAPASGGGPGGPQPGLSNNDRMRFLASEGVAAVVSTSARNDFGTVFGAGSVGTRRQDALLDLIGLGFSAEHYNRIVRTVAKGVPVTLEMFVQSTAHDEDRTAFNVVAEIPGTDKRDEVVMLGAHFDSWHYGTGATDNASGSAVMLEAMRILKTLNLPMRRTVRLALWTGEEQGLLGSRAYVDNHFAERATMQLKPDHAKFQAYFNMDNGTGAFRGVYLQGNEWIGPVFRAWMEPFRDLGMNTITIRNTGGTDHQAFDAVGLPGFQFIQDEIEYGSRTHHSNMDSYERLIPEDLKKNAVIVASFVYHAANRAELLPREALPARPAPLAAPARP